MAKNAKQRQQKLAAKNARRNRRKLTRSKPVSIACRIEQASHWPIVSAKVSASLFDQGIGAVVLVRQAVNGTSAFAHFLVDTWCLGVKDVFVNILNRDEAAARASDISSRMGQMKNVTPEYLRKLILKAVEFSQSLGIQPAANFGLCSRILDGIDESQCRDEFEFGKDGKPLFLAGPHDGPARIQQIMETLARSTGEGNFDYILPLDPRDVRPGELFDADGNEVHLEWMHEDVDTDSEDDGIILEHTGNLRRLISGSE